MAEICLSLLSCAEVSHYGYLYAKIRDERHYQIATGYVKAGMLSGQCLSGLFGQLVVSLGNRDYSTLPYYSLAGMVCIILYHCYRPLHDYNNFSKTCSLLGVTFAFFWACFLPPVKQSTYFNVVTDHERKTDFFSKAVIHDPDIPRYYTEQDELKNVSN